MRRSLSIAILAVLMSLGWATPVSAHGALGVGATNYKTILSSFEPRVDGVSLRVIELGESIELTNYSPVDVVVFGYENEPYLRVGPGGVFVNERSPAYYLNQNFDLTFEPPPTADAAAAPEWKKISSSQSTRWHDHRAHWMGGQAPPPVRADRSRSHVVIPNWDIPMNHGGKALHARGDVFWVPPASRVVWWTVIVLGVFAGLFVVIRRRRLDVTGHELPVIAMFAGLVVLEVLHTAGGLMTVPLSRIGVALEGLVAPILAIVMGAYGVVRLWRRNDDGIWLGLFTTLLVAVVSGLSDVSFLDRSQLPTALPSPLARATVALAIGLGGGLALTFVLAIRTARVPLSQEQPPEQ